ncbi:MAG: alpha-amylase, partial [Bacteroidota bacterium]|nr:alpha-amylase [Bacteroidota bacterium]
YKWFVLREPASGLSPQKEHLQLRAEHWDAVFSGETLTVLQNEILPDYISNKQWFTGKDKTLYSTSVTAHTSLPVGQSDVEVLLIEVQFQSGLPEYYQLPVIFVNKEEGIKLATAHPAAIIAQLKMGNEEGFLCDAVYAASFQHEVLSFIANTKRFMASGEIVFISNEEVRRKIKNKQVQISKVQATSEMHTAIIYNNQFFLKIYRKVDKGIHPDVELSRFLAASDVHTTKYAGDFEWRINDGVFVLGMLERLEENHGDGHQYMLERIVNFIERILARDKQTLFAYPKKGSLTEPVGFDDLADELKEFIGGSAAELARLAGMRLAQIHKALANSLEKDFLPEEFSLHYQRSLFSSMTSLVREMGQAIDKKSENLPDEISEDVKKLNSEKELLLNTFRRIYNKKFDVQKIRTHGNFGLSHVLLTGKDIVIHDFGGNPLRPYSERRLKRSPLLDVAAGIRSFYYVAYEGFLSSSQMQSDEQNSLLHFAGFWAHYMSGFFMRAYLDEVKDTAFIPKEPADFEVLIQTLLLENALHWFNYEVAHRPQRAVIPLRIIQTIVE